MKLVMMFDLSNRVFYELDRNVTKIRPEIAPVCEVVKADRVERSGAIQRLCGGSERRFRNFFFNSGGIYGFE